MLDGELNLADLPRVVEVLADVSGKAVISLQFLRDIDHRVVIKGRISLTAVVECQRCGEPLALALDHTTDMSPVITDDQAAHVPKEYDPLVTHGEPLNVLAVVEDEILLALPMVPKHAKGDCPVTLPDCLT